MKKLIFLVIILLASISDAGITMSGAGTITYSGSGSTTITVGSGGGGTAVTLTNISHTSCNANTYTGTCAFSPNVTAGSVLIAGCVMQATGDTMTFGDNNGNTWTPVVTSVWEGEGNGTRRANIFYTLNANAGATTTTCADSGHTAGVIQQSIHEYSKSGTATFDVTSSSAPLGTSASITGRVMTTSFPNEFAFGFVTLLNGAATGQSGTLRENYVNNYYQATEDQVNAAAGAQTLTFTQASPSAWIMIQAAFK